MLGLLEMLILAEVNRFPILLHEDDRKSCKKDLLYEFNNLTLEFSLRHWINLIKINIVLLQV
ncbi:MAG: hypothetical protein ACRD8Z_16945, partial [Nitrososphaeraceae archaeon]